MLCVFIISCDQQITRITQNARSGSPSGFYSASVVYLFINAQSFTHTYTYTLRYIYVEQQLSVAWQWWRP